MKKAVLQAVAVMMALLLCACSGGDATPEQEETPAEPKEPLPASELKKVFSDPESYIGERVELGGVVFTAPEYGEDTVTFQMWSDPVNREWNTIVGYGNPNLDIDLEEGQYVKVIGEIETVFEGENMWGATITAPAISAENVEISSYMDVVAPTIATAAAASPSIDQNGYVVTAEKVELSDTETRLYLSVSNNGSGNFNLYTFNMYLIQDGTQYETQTNFDGDYPELQNDIRPGVTSEAIITFPPIQQTDFQIVMEGRSDNWEENFDEYTFNFNFG